MSTNTSNGHDNNDKKMRFGIIGAVLLATCLIAASYNPTLVASISNSVANGVGMGTLTLEETNAEGSVTCFSESNTGNAATCFNINKYSDVDTSMLRFVSTVVTLKNSGTIDSTSFVLEGGECTQQSTVPAIGTATDLCTKANVNVLQDGVSVYNGNPAGLTNVTLKALKAGESAKYTFDVSIPETLNHSYQGSKTALVLNWNWKLAA